MDRYNHDLGGEDTDDTDDTPVFGSFSSYTPQYRKQHYSWSRVASTTSITSSINSTSTTTTLNNAMAATVTALAETKFQVTESTSSPTNTVDSVAKCRKIAAPLASPSSHNILTQHMVNKVLNTPQLRKIEVSLKKKSFHNSVFATETFL